MYLSQSAMSTWVNV